jgi:protein-S-isoprenylcysteine O-methyltransferase Ste14
MLGPLLFRLLVALAITAAAGGTWLWREPVFIAFLVLEAIWSLLEGSLSRGERASVSEWHSADPRQIPWVLLGKRYLFARILYHVVVLTYFGGVGSLTAWLTGPVALFGATLMVVGIALRAWAMLTLGERFRGFEVRAEAKELETQGPYAVVRHPGYLAFILFDLGMPLLLNSFLMLPFVVVPIVLLIQRVSAEEELLMTAYPADYPDYVARTTWRIVPRLY